MRTLSEDMPLVVGSRSQPVLRYAGAKWTIAPWIIQQMPHHQAYVEPFCGSCAVLLAKAPVAHELVCDRADEIVTLFRVIREQPEELAMALAMTPYSRAEHEASYVVADDMDDVERARRFLVRVWMSHGGKLGRVAGWRLWRDPGTRLSNSMPKLWRALPDRIWSIVDRLRDVHIECRDYREVIPLYSGQAEALIYCDPPYVQSTLGTDKLYLHDMTDEDHLELLDLLDRHAGPVLLSGYPSALYDERLVDWRRLETTANASGGAERTECLWLNPVAIARNRQLTLL